MLENKRTATVLRQMRPLQQRYVTAALFLLGQKRKEKYKVFKETVLQLNVTTTEWEKKTGGHLPLGLYSGERNRSGEHWAQLVPAKSTLSVFFSDAHSTHKHTERYANTQTHTRYLQHLEYLVTG